MTLPQLKSAIETLSEQERVDLRSWLAGIDERQQEAWDAQIERDAQPGGRLDGVISRAKAHIAEGRTKPLNEVIRDL